MILKRLIVCASCNQQILPVSDRLEIPEYRNDHGPACCCMSCVVARGEKRIAEERVRHLGAR